MRAPGTSQPRAIAAGASGIEAHGRGDPPDPRRLERRCTSRRATCDRRRRAASSHRLRSPDEHAGASGGSCAESSRRAPSRHASATSSAMTNGTGARRRIERRVDGRATARYSAGVEPRGRRRFTTRDELAAPRELHDPHDERSQSAAACGSRLRACDRGARSDALAAWLARRADAQAQHSTRTAACGASAIQPASKGSTSPVAASARRAAAIACHSKSRCAQRGSASCARGRRVHTMRAAVQRRTRCAAPGEAARRCARAEGVARPARAARHRARGPCRRTRARRPAIRRDARAARRASASRSSRRSRRSAPRLRRRACPATPHARSPSRLRDQSMGDLAAVDDVGIGGWRAGEVEPQAAPARRERVAERGDERRLPVDRRTASRERRPPSPREPASCGKPCCEIGRRAGIRETPSGIRSDRDDALDADRIAAAARIRHRAPSRPRHA